MRRFTRTEMLIGDWGLKRLASSRVAVIGLGGVGSYTVEALARAGIGFLRLVDHDRYELSNINRQLYALDGTVDRLKTEVAAERLARINPDLSVEALPLFLTADLMNEVITPDLDYVVDAVDTIVHKVELISYCFDLGLPLISCMGTGNRIDPSGFVFADISKTHTCPLARAVRTLLREKGIREGVEVLFSTVPPIDIKERAPGSISFVPSLAGLLLASKVVNHLLSR